MRSFAYDGLRRLTSATNPEQTKPTSYTYDANNNIQTRTDALGVTTTYSYDALNRLTGKTYSDNTTPNGTYNWDVAGVTNGVGRLGSVSNSVAKRNYTAYDALGNVTASSMQNLLDGQTYTFSNYKYDLAGGLISETYPSGRVLTTAYDGAERPITVTGQPTSGSATTYVQPISNSPEYWPHGAPYAYQYANQVVLGSPAAVGFTYDAEGRVTSSQSSSPNVAVNYYYDGEGNRIQKSVTGGTTTAFVHDAFGKAGGRILEQRHHACLRHLLLVVRSFGQRADGDGSER